MHSPVPTSRPDEESGHDVANRRLAWHALDNESLAMSAGRGDAHGEVKLMLGSGGLIVSAALVQICARDAARSEEG